MCMQLCGTRSNRSEKKDGTVIGDRACWLMYMQRTGESYTL